jgi:glycosyltransferase involved in cell wall biosynthesis
MRIAYDHQIFGWQKYGGVSRYFYEIASRMPLACDCSVKIYAPLFVNAYLKEKPLPSTMGLPFVHIPKSGRAMQIITAPLVKYLLRRDMPDILHETYYYENKLAYPKTKTILTVFDMVHEKYSSCYRSGDRTASIKKKAVMRADHIICISENTRKDLIEILNVDYNKTTVVLLGNSIVPSINGESRRLIPLPYIAYVGLRGGYKNFANLLRAYASSNWLRKNFVIACFGGGPLGEGEYKIMSSLNIPVSTVIQIDGGDDELSDFYRYAEIFVYPSLYEGFGIPPLEAMGLDCPVACSNTSSVPEVVGNAGVYFNPIDIDDMRNSIETVLSDSILRAKLVVAGRERIKEFTWDKCTKETLNAYQHLLS